MKYVVHKKGPNVLILRLLCRRKYQYCRDIQERLFCSASQKLTYVFFSLDEQALGSHKLIMFSRMACDMAWEPILDAIIQTIEEEFGKEAVHKSIRRLYKQMAVWGPIPAEPYGE